MADACPVAGVADFLPARWPPDAVPACCFAALFGGLAFVSFLAVVFFAVLFFAVLVFALALRLRVACPPVPAGSPAEGPLSPASAAAASL